MNAELKPWDAAEFLDTPERIAAYIDAVIEDGDPAMMAAAKSDVARALGLQLGIRVAPRAEPDPVA